MPDAPANYRCVYVIERANTVAITLLRLVLRCYAKACERYRSECLKENASLLPFATLGAGADFQLSTDSR